MMDQQANPVNGVPGSSRFSPARRANAVTLFWTIAMAGLLAFASFAKFHSPQKDKETFDYAIASVQILIIVGMLVFWRRWWTWAALAVMWAGMSAWSIYASKHGYMCGCFGALIDVPKYASGVVDAMLALVSLSLVALRGAPLSMVGATVLGVAVAAPIGWYSAEALVTPNLEKTLADAAREAARDAEPSVDQAPADDPGASAVEPAHDDRTVAAPTHAIAPPDLPETPGFTVARERLLASDLLADVREQEVGGPAWLIFVFDPDCHICEALMPYMSYMEETWAETGDPVMQIRKLSIPDLRDELGIERNHWPGTPTIFVVRDGEIAAQWYGETVDGWEDPEIQTIYDAFEVDDPDLLPAPMQWEELQ